MHTKKLNSNLSTLVEGYLGEYIQSHNLSDCNGALHALVMGQVEKPLIAVVLQHTNGNQSQAAEILGINRNTLRKKIHEFNL
jgi:DNA-binding protein Fis